MEITKQVTCKIEEIKLSKDTAKKTADKSADDKSDLQSVYYVNHAQERKTQPKYGSIPTETISVSKVLDESKQEILSCRFDEDGSHIALGLFNGDTAVHSALTGKLLRTLTNPGTSEAPVTSIRWRPRAVGVSTKIVLVTGSSDGTIAQWHFLSGTLLNKVVEEDNQILAMDFNPDGTLLAAGGSNHKIQIYDETTMKVNATLERSLYDEPGHSNRVFSVKFIPEEPHLLLSGGWDNNIHIWDVREGKSIHCMYGHMISGDSIDYKDKVILTGHISSKDQLNLWDFGTRKLLRKIQWDYGYDNEKMNVYAAQFSKKSDKYILACGTGYNEARLFSKEADYMDFAKVTGFSKGLFTLDFTPDDDMFAIAGANGEAHLVKLSE